MAGHNNLIGLYRRQAGLTQQELGEKVSVSKNSIYKWEKEGVPDAYQLLRITEFFIKEGIIKDYATAQAFWDAGGRERFIEPPNLQQLFEQHNSEQDVVERMGKQKTSAETLSDEVGLEVDNGSVVEVSKEEGVAPKRVKITVQPWLKRRNVYSVVLFVCLLTGGTYYITSPPLLQRTIVNEMALVPAGPFLQGSTPEQLTFFEKLCTDNISGCTAVSFEDELPQRQVTLDEFWIDVHEVTNAEFQRFIVENPTYRTTAEIRGSSLVWDELQHNFVDTPGASWRHPQGQQTSIDQLAYYPVVHISYQDANTYCAWAKKRLPTEAEWEKAARGPYGWLFPWGNEWEPSHLRFAAGGVSVSASEVGSFPQGASIYGVEDLLGNVSEWVADWYDPDYYKKNFSTTNPQGPSASPTHHHTRRGGSWTTRAGYLHSAWRIEIAEQTTNTLGFRCAQASNPYP